ncbi:hypothetical protein, partial [Streptococcus sp.]|uniref:hypothetical protein n=1 Tax=Streptococcus sp. TaxID=1306 RepID=UPI0025CEBFFF
PFKNKFIPLYQNIQTIYRLKNACLRKTTVLSFVNKRYMLIYSHFMMSVPARRMPSGRPELD